MSDHATDVRTRPAVMPATGGVRQDAGRAAPGPKAAGTAPATPAGSPAARELAQRRELLRQHPKVLQLSALAMALAQRRPTLPVSPSPSMSGSDVVVQRVTLGPKAVLKALLTIPFMQARLGETLHLRRDHRDTGAKIETMQQHVEAVLKQYDKRLKSTADAGTAHAMAIATVLEAVARVIAVNDLNDPALTPLLTTKLIEFYRAEIEASFQEMDEAEGALKLATALTVDDPVTLYMHKELRIEEAARRIRQMADLGSKTPEAMFDLLRQRFELEMSTLDRGSVGGREDTGNAAGSFSVREATGEVSTDYLATLFPGTTKPAKWVKGGEGGRRTLAFGAEAATRLDNLRTAVAAPPGARDPGFTGAARTWQRPGEAARTLTIKQSAHLAAIEQADRGEDVPGIDAAVLAAFKRLFRIDDTGALAVLHQVKTGLATLPIILTVKGQSWFAAGDPLRPVYAPGSSRSQTAAYSTLFQKPAASGQVRHLGEFNDTTGQGRGKNYGRFRNWKDQAMTGNRGLSDTELPSFAAVNINWPARSSQSATAYGENSYGDTHFILRKANVSDRLVYTATDHGRPHRDIYLAFADFVVGTEPSMSQTGLKKTANDGVVRHIVNTLMTGKLVIAPVQCFEVQIFGELDVRKDVEKIAVAPSVGPTVAANIQAFCGRQNPPITFEAIANPTEAVVNARWFTPSDPNAAGMAEELQDLLTGDASEAV